VWVFRSWGRVVQVIGLGGVKAWGGAKGGVGGGWMGLPAACARSSAVSAVGEHAHFLAKILDADLGVFGEIHGAGMGIVPVSIEDAVCTMGGGAGRGLRPVGVEPRVRESRLGVGFRSWTFTRRGF